MPSQMENQTIARIIHRHRNMNASLHSNTVHEEFSILLFIENTVSICWKHSYCWALWFIRFILPFFSYCLSFFLLVNPFILAFKRALAILNSIDLVISMQSCNQLHPHDAWLIHKPQYILIDGISLFDFKSESFGIFCIKLKHFRVDKVKPTGNHKIVPRYKW